MLPFNLNIPRMGYFILYRNKGDLFGKAIEKRQVVAGFFPLEARYTHIEVSGGGEYSVNISPPISKLIKIVEHHKGRYIRIVRFKNEDYEARGRYKVAYFSATLCNKGYDIGGILAFVFKWIKQNNRLFFCSEGAAWALCKEYSEAFGGLMPDKIMPAAFLEPIQFETIWEGELP
jgi:hypothetical protein